MFADADLTDDKFLNGRLRLWQPIQGYRAATDPVLLAASVPARAGARVLDLGCGAGAAGLCVAARVDVALAGLEVQPDYADLARRNAARNGITMQVVDGDVTALPPILRRDFDHVIANPPYYHAAGTPSPIMARDRALRVDVPISVWIDTALRRLIHGGYLTFILSTELLPTALTALAPRAGSVSVLPLTSRSGRAAGRVILQARKGSRGSFRLLSPLVLHEGQSHAGDCENYSPVAKAVLRDGCDLSAMFG